MNIKVDVILSFWNCWKSDSSIGQRNGAHFAIATPTSNAVVVSGPAFMAAQGMPASETASATTTTSQQYHDGTNETLGHQSSERG